METKRIDDYFKKTRQLPLAMSFAEVQSLVGLKGATSPPKKSWWNLNNIIIMSTSIIIITTAALLFNTAEVKASYEPVERTFEISTKDDFEPEEAMSYFADVPQKIEEEPADSVRDSTQVIEQTNSLISNTEQNEISSIQSSIKTIDQSEPVVASAKPIEPIAPMEPIEPMEPMVDQEEPKESKLGGDFDGEVKTMTKSISAENINTFYLKHSNGDIDITTWDKNEIEVTAIFKLKTSDPEDAKLGLEDFNLHLSAMGSKTNISTNWDELNNCSCTDKTSEPKGFMKLLYFPSKNKAKTDSGESFEYENFKIVYEVKIPKQLNIDVSNKYANVSVPEVDGDLSANLFRGNLKAKNVSNNVDLVVKYGGLNIGSFLEGDVNLYRADATIGASDRVDLKANYSTVDYAGGKELNLSAFRSDVTSSAPIDELEGSHKYGKLKLEGHVIEADLVTFRSEIRANSFDKLELDASYTEVRATKVHQLDVENGFRCDFRFDEVAKVEGSLKYSPLKIGILTEMADINAFRGEVEIQQVNADFKQLNFKTKYTDIDLSFNPDAKYELDAQTTYSNFKVPEEVMDITLQNAVNNNSNHFVGTFNKASSKTTSKVFVDSFQGVIRLN